MARHETMIRQYAQKRALDGFEAEFTIRFAAHSFSKQMDVSIQICLGLFVCISRALDFHAEWHAT